MYLVLLINLTILFSCNTSVKKDKNKPNELMDTSVYERKDELGRIIEKWGLDTSWDNKGNFRFFFEYDSNSNLVVEKRFFFEDDNINCIIIDTLDYDEIRYHYKFVNDNLVLFKKEKSTPLKDENEKIYGRELYYTLDVIKDKFIFHKDIGHKESKKQD